MAVNLSDTTRAVQQEQRAWIRELSRWKRLDASTLAVRAGLSGTTLTRLINDPDYRGTLRADTIKRLTETYGVPTPEEYARGALFPGIEAERFDYKSATPELARTVKQLIAERPGLEPWRLRGEALAAVGYLAGDVVIVDANAAPKPQDAVCAEAYDLDRGAANLIWRVYDPPYLVGAGPERTGWKPLAVDGERVRITGVIAQMIRPHPLSATK
jgi:hypothetical protein